jgi:hypothetical protein
MEEKTEMKRKVGKEPEGGSKKRRTVGNESPLASTFQKQQTAHDLQKALPADLALGDVAGGECFKVFMLDIAQQMNAQGMAQLVPKALFLNW